MAKKRVSAAHGAARAKSAREKKILAVLGLVLPLALFYAYHTMTKLHSSVAPSAPAVSSTSTPVVPVGDTSTTPATSAVLPTVPADSGQLNSLRGLGRIDPFHDAGPQTTTTAGGSQQPSSTGGKSGKHKQSGKKAKQKKAKQKGKQQQVAVTPTSAVISVNGSAVSVAVGTAFGHAPGFANQQLFRVVALTAKTAEIGVVGSKQTFVLKVAKPLTLTLTLGPAAKWNFTLLLYSQAAAAAVQTQTTTTTGG